MRYLLLFSICIALLAACSKDSTAPDNSTKVDEQKVQEQRERILGTWQVLFYGDDKNKDGIIEESEKISVDSITIRLSYSADGTLSNSLVDHRNSANNSSSTGTWAITNADRVSHTTSVNPPMTNEYDIIELTDTSFIVQEKDGYYRTVTEKL